MYNTTGYRSVITGQSESSNYCGYVLMDYQLRRSNYEHPNQGLYAGGSFMTVPDSLIAYASKEEIGPFLQADEFGLQLFSPRLLVDYPKEAERHRAH